MASSSPPGEADVARIERLPSLSEPASTPCEPVLAAPPPAPATLVANSTVLKSPPPLASSIAHQSSIYSLTLDEFQNALGGSGKHFGSMNMDEFLKNIWTAEESQAMAVAIGAGSNEASHAWYAGIQRQGSISLPRTLSRKTVEDVWKDIAGANIDMGLGLDSASASAGQERQVTFAEITLEDFLTKAGVIVKENGLGGQSLTPFGTSFDKTSLDNAFSSIPVDDIAEKLGHGSAFFGYKGMEDVKPNVKALPTLSLSTGNLKPGQAGLDSMQMDALKRMSPSPRPLDWLTNNSYRSGTAHMHTHQAYNNIPQHVIEANVNKVSVGNGALMGPETTGIGMLAENNFVGPDFGVGVGAGGLAPCMSPLGLKTGSPSSPLSDGVGPSHGSMSSLSPLSYAHDGAIGGRKRGFEGGVEKVVERRQRRMIKNRESAARSRARKQAYTVELEAEVMQLKEENLRLHMLQEEMADMRRKQFIDVLNSLGRHVAPKARTLRRTQTGPW